MKVSAAGTRFVLREDGGIAELRYRLEGDQLVLEHTEVPEALGGQGIGSALVKAAVERARADGFGLLVECQFASAWLRRHAADVADLRIEYAPT